MEEWTTEADRRGYFHDGDLHVEEFVGVRCHARNTRNGEHEVRYRTGRFLGEWEWHERGAYNALATRGIQEVLIVVAGIKSGQCAEIYEWSSEDCCSIRKECGGTVSFKWKFEIAIGRSDGPPKLQ